jgi:hypothetical protein
MLVYIGLDNSNFYEIEIGKINRDKNSLKRDVEAR